jgi:dihydroorotate dehydrogenase
MYRLLFTLILSRFDPEDAHTLAFAVIRLLPLFGIGRLVRRMTRPAPSLSVSALGLEFDSPFGVAAGFDKDGRGIRGLGQLGFGHVEVGTVTAIPQSGNLRPRLFRLIKDRAVINRMGFNNHGATALAPKLKKVRRLAQRPRIGVNIGKSRSVELDDAIDDYRASTRAVTAFADYLAVNVSSPNTPGLRSLQSPSTLKPLLAAVLDEAGTTPVLVKIAPDLSNTEALDIAQLAVRLGLAGIIATNTTTSRAGLSSPPALIDAAGNGGLSGAPLAARSLELLRLIRAAVPADFCIISVGGVDSAGDVAERLAAGATLVQGYTAFLYRGPFWARAVNRGLMRGTRRA